MKQTTVKGHSRDLCDIPSFIRGLGSGVLANQLPQRVLTGSVCQFLGRKYTVADFKLQVEQPAYKIPII